MDFLWLIAMPLGYGVLLTLFLASFYRSNILPVGQTRQPETVRPEKENILLKQEVRQYANILNRSHNPVWVRDEHMQMVYYNLAFSLVSDNGEEEEDALELYRGERMLAREAWEAGKELVHTKRIVVDGERRLYQIRLVPSREDACVSGYAMDVTRQDEAREEIQRYVQAQRDLLESSTSAMAIYGRDQRLKFYNFAFVALWKLDDDWLDEEPTYGEVIEALREKRSLPEQANFKAFKDKHLKLFTTLIEPEEEFYFLPDGRTLRVVAIPHALGGLLFSYEDVTDRLALERSYNTLIAVQKETLDNLHEGVVVFGEDGRLRLSNPAYLTMWKLSEEDVGSRPHINQILEKTRAYYHYADWESFCGEAIGRLQSRNVSASRLEREDGSVLDWSSVPLPDGGTLITYIDVTASTLVERSLREKNDALQEADRMKTKFLANVPYELRSPLTSIIGFNDMLRQDYVGKLNKKQREYLDRIAQSAEHLSSLISNILDLSSLEAGYLTLNIAPVEIRTLLEASLELVAGRVEERELKVKLDCPADIGLLEADAGRLKQVIFHLLHNAVKYTPRGKNIVVRAESDGADFLKIMVEDTGIGIEPERIRQVFERFYRGGSAEGQQSGSGLGLSMVKSFVELHGGTVSIVSAPGKGTTVTCRLPRITHREEKAA